MDFVALGSHGARWGGLRRAGLALRKPGPARTGPRLPWPRPASVRALVPVSACSFASVSRMGNRMSGAPRRGQDAQAGMVPVAAGAGPAPARPRPGADPTVLAGLGQPRPGVTKVNAGPAARHATLQVS